MKQFIKPLLLAILLVTIVPIASAYRPYNMSAGINLGSLQGVSYKMFVTDRFAFQADFGGKISFMRINSYHNDQYTMHVNETNWALVLNPNGMYEQNFLTTSSASLYWFAGGGLSIGYSFSNHFRNTGQFGVNAIGGMESAFFAVPLTLQIDFRPGYGMLFSNNITHNFFDWSLNLSLRYYF